LDAAMNFAINAALVGRDRTEATIEMTTELMRPALLEGHYVVRGDVVRLTRQIAYAEATITSDEGNSSAARRARSSCTDRRRLDVLGRDLTETTGLVVLEGLL
jgi:acyl-coenzyme A thioesterase PaaI-like protein